MKLAILSAVGGIAITVAIVAATSPGQSMLDAAVVDPSSSTAAETLQVDAVHSAILFKIRHNGVSTSWGRINNVRGTFTIDEGNPAASKLNVFAETKDIDTANAQRDDHLRSTDFFNAREYPTLSFVSTSVKKGTGADVYEVTGNLSLHGVTKEISVTLQSVTTGKSTGMGVRGGFDTQFTIKRTEFGMDKYVAEGSLGDEVTIFVSVEGVRRG